MYDLDFVLGGFGKGITGGPTVGRTDGRTDGLTDGRADPLIGMCSRI